MKKICVLGLGYVGLPTASMFATHGFQVVGVDVNEAVVQSLINEEIHIEEPGLKTLVRAAIRSGHLSVQGAPEPADIFIIAVPTPATEAKEADLRYVRAAAESIVPYLKGGDLVILESTVPPRTTQDVLVPILERSGLTAGRDFLLAHCPERVLPGSVLIEMVQNARVIGGIDRKSAEAAGELYRSFVHGDIYMTDAVTAEMVKLMENTYRDVNIALANEFALIAEDLSLNVWKAIEIANKHPRVNIHRPGPGVGGHCIAVDPWFIAQMAPGKARLIKLSREVNDGMPSHVADMVRKELTGVQNPGIAVLGVTYKGDIDDVRGSPALMIIEKLLRFGFQVRIFDPHVKALAEFEEFLLPLEEAVAGTHCLLVLVDHRQFKAIDPHQVGSLMKDKLVIDAKNCLAHSDWQREGFRVVLLGRGGEQ